MTLKDLPPKLIEMLLCELCDGTGQVPLQFSMMLDGFCDFCGGTGKVKKYYDVVECKEYGGIINEYVRLF